MKRKVLDQEGREGVGDGEGSACLLFLPMHHPRQVCGGGGTGVPLSLLAPCTRQSILGPGLHDPLPLPSSWGPSGEREASWVHFIDDTARAFERLEVSGSP